MMLWLIIGMSILVICIVVVTILAILTSPDEDDLK